MSYVATHGHSAKKDEAGKRIISPTYKTWRSMKARCDYPSVNGYKYYGGRGISYDIRWGLFANFLSDMGERPEGMTLDRIDSDKDYYKENCRWVTPAAQQHNRKDRPTEQTIKTVRGLLKLGWSQTKIAKLVGVHPSTVSNVFTGKHHKVAV